MDFWSRGPWLVREKKEKKSYGMAWVIAWVWFFLFLRTGRPVLQDGLRCSACFLGWEGIGRLFLYGLTLCLWDEDDGDDDTCTAATALSLLVFRLRLVFLYSFLLRPRRVLFLSRS